jgi:carboxymethylenebutenolidase
MAAAKTLAHTPPELGVRKIAMGTRITFWRADGQPNDGYLAKAAAAHAPGIVVIQEWWGLQDQIKGICDRLALSGYNALAPDLYAGTIVPYHDHAAAMREMKSLNFLDAADQIARGAAQYLRKNGAKAGLTGFCMGGAVTILGAARVPEFAAAVAFYGLPPEGAVSASDIKIPLQGHYAKNDDYGMVQHVAKFEAGLKAAKADFEFFHYDADHGFMNEQRDAHERAASEQAWGRMLGFWAKHLGA